MVQVLLAFQDDRKAKAELDEREKEVRQAKEVASAEAHAHSSAHSQPLASPSLSAPHSILPARHENASDDHSPMPGSDDEA